MSDPMRSSNVKTGVSQCEERLDQIRRDAERGTLSIVGARPSGAPFPQASSEKGYYGIPLLKEPPWTWEIPLYFFVGGAAGAAAVIGAIAHYTGADRKLIRDARRIAVAGSLISPALLIADLGRPARFLAMLRVFKPQSPMSVGVWTLLGFSTGATAAAFAQFLRDRYGAAFPVRILENTGEAVSLAFGLPFSNYTGVLIGATSIPIWNRNAAHLPLHFGASGLGSAVGMLEILGHRSSRALQALGLGAAILETIEGAYIESRSHTYLDPLKHGASGWITRTGAVLSGPLPTLLRTLSLFRKTRPSGRIRSWAAWSAVVGSLITRMAWLCAGHQSARNWEHPLEINERSTRQRATSLPSDGSG
jgi:hypothetical protein